MGGVVADSHLRHAFAARKRTEIFRVNKKDRKNTKQMFFMLGGKSACRKRTVGFQKRNEVFGLIVMLDALTVGLQRRFKRKGSALFRKSRILFFGAQNGGTVGIQSAFVNEETSRRK